MVAVPPKFIKANGICKLNPAYIQWKKETGGVQQVKHEDPIDSMTLRVSVIQGSDLVAKDRNFMGKKTTSDPYVEILLGTGRAYVRIGKTKTIYKNLSPQWNETIATRVRYIEHGGSNIMFRIFDEDKFSDPDNMGIVTLPLVWKDDSGSPQWYDIPKNSAKNAKGKIQLQIQTQVHRIQGMASYV